MTENEAIKILNGIEEVRGKLPEDGEEVEIALNMAIKALEQQPCEDCISRQEAISAIINEYYPDTIAIDIVDTIANLPSVTPTRPTARWERLVDDYKKCSRCGRPVKFYRKYKHCPECGAKMQEVEE